METPRNERHEVRIMLCRNALPKTWLIAQLEAAGIIVDAPRLNKMLSGSIRGATADEVIDASTKILHRYEAAMGVSFD